MIRQHHKLNGYEFEQTLGDSEGQGPEKRSPGTAFRPGWETLFTGSKASEPPEGKY